ncbi:MAG: DNA helicase UvrD [Proteobacteria bacterium]|nr:DNA helicase UvrD [Pseudomonadota bacterium]
MGGRSVSTLQFISAGAGSGKTYTLTKILGDELQKGSVQPGGVIATTFTVKAATELRERVRQHLLGNGLFDLANAMGQARIGTVNGVCGELLERFAFENGLAPTLQVVDEDQAKVLMQKTVDDVLSGETVDELIGLSWRLGIEDWRADLRKLVMEVRANRIDPSTLPAMAIRNAESLLEKFGKPYAEDLSAQLMAGIETVLEDLKPFLAMEKVTNKTKKYYQDVLNFRRALRNSRAPWSEWIKFSKNDPGKKAMTPAIEEAAKLAGMCTVHPMLHADIRSYLRTLFETCASIIENYQTRKKELGVVDFTDQEALFLEMLDNPDVAAVLSDELDLLLVDEFQDTSPMQLALFLKLSTFAKQCYFVGDIKQAIYGFRGSSPELMQRLFAAFPEIGGDVRILDKSWRSRPPLVHLVNAVFKHAFEESLQESEVVLTPQRKEVTNSPAFANWILEGANVGERFEALAGGVRALVDSAMSVPDSGSAVRPVRYGDIAILTRTNDGVDAVSGSLRGAGIPVATASAGLLKTPEAALARACLRRVSDKSDTLATAEIISLAECAEPEEWLTNRLHYLQQKQEPKVWLEAGPGAHRLLVRIAALRDRLEVLTPHEMLRLLVTECELPALVMQWCGNAEMARLRLANLEALINLAEQYQLTCRSLRETVTIAGFLAWLDEVEEAETDALATPALDAVTVMTCHKAKGLEWPVVILAELEKTIRSGVWSISTFSEGDFRADNPLAGRCIHYWPWPFGKQSTGIDVLETIESSDEYKKSLSAAIEEGKRLLYVAMTRPRDMLILAHNPKGRSANSWLRTLGADWLVPGEKPETQLVLPDGTSIPSVACLLVAEEPAQQEDGHKTLFWFQSVKDRSEYPPLFVSPSGVEGRETLIICQENIGSPMHVNPGQLDWNVAGDALHACLAASFTDVSAPLEQEEIQEILAGFDVGEALSASEVKAQTAALHDWVRSRWPQGIVRAEVPVSCGKGDGQILQGWIDLLVETPAGFVIIDHKSSMGSAGRLQEIAEAYSGQLDAYASAVKVATGKGVAEKWLFLPVLAMVICVG